MTPEQFDALIPGDFIEIKAGYGTQTALVTTFPKHTPHEGGPIRWIRAQRYNARSHGWTARAGVFSPSDILRVMDIPPVGARQALDNQPLYITAGLIEEIRHTKRGLKVRWVQGYAELKVGRPFGPGTLMTRRDIYIAEGQRSRRPRFAESFMFDVVPVQADSSSQ